MEWSGPLTGYLASKQGKSIVTTNSHTSLLSQKGLRHFCDVPWENLCHQAELNRHSICKRHVSNLWCRFWQLLKIPNKRTKAVHYHLGISKTANVGWSGHPFITWMANIWYAIYAFWSWPFRIASDKRLFEVKTWPWSAVPTYANLPLQATRP